MPATISLVAAESWVAAMLAAAAGIMLAGYALDAVGLPMTPWLLGLAGLTTGAVIFRAVSYVALDHPAGRANSSRTFLAIVSVSLIYLLWLASPSFLPVAEGPDIVHHLSLIHLIQRTHRLAHDPRFQLYLVELMNYTPGSQILAATIADWFRVDALRVVYPVMAACVALKLGLIYLVALRVLPPDSCSPLQAAAASLLLVAPAEYFFGSFLRFDFYAQVVSETFAAGMLLAIVACKTTGYSRPWLLVFASCAVGAYLSWPVWVPPAFAAVAAVILMRPASARDRATDASIACGVPLLVAVVHGATHSGGASILGSSGLVTVPTIQVFGVGFVLLTAVGGLLALTDRRARPVLVFAVATVLQAVALAMLNRRAGSASLYLPYKMAYLFVLPATVLAVLPLAHFSAFLLEWSPRRRAAIALIPLAVAALLLRGRVPTHRQQSPITEPAFRAGLWARSNLPRGCIDYFSRHWLTGYWLHLDVLGNPKISDRMRSETFEFRDTVGKWIEGHGLPYGIVEDLRTIPNEARAEMQPVYRVHETAVVRRLGRATCDDSSLPIDLVEGR